MVATSPREQTRGSALPTTVHAAPFTAEDLARVRATAVEEHVPAGTRMLASGERVGRVLVVGSGEVQLLARGRAGRHVAAVVRAGGVIGDIPLFLDAPMPFDAVVSQRALVCELDHDALQAFLASAPSASLRWMRSIAQRLDDDRRRLLAITTKDLTAQVADLLLRNAEADAGEEPIVRLSHDVMAQLLGARRQSITRVLADLRTRGLVATAYRRIVLRDVDALRDLAGPSLP